MAEIESGSGITEPDGTRIEDLVPCDIVVASGLERLREGQRCSVAFDGDSGPYVIADPDGETGDNRLYLTSVVKADGTLDGLSLTMKSPVRQAMAALRQD